MSFSLPSQDDAPLFMANRILDNVFVGSHYAAEDEDFIFTNTISRVINTVSHQVPNRFQSLNVKYLSYEFDYNGGSQIFDPKDERITQIVRFVNEAIEQDTCVLIHSQNGDSRSVIIMAAYLIHRFHWPPQRALQFISTKRFCSKPNVNYVKQLHEFAGRRRAKYGEFKDIFGNIKGLKLNFEEILHRNTFLNAVQEEEPQDLTFLQPSPIDVLVKLNVIQKQLSSKITFRDGLQTAQISANYANFDANGKPLNPAMCSQLFRPKTPSYSSAEQTRCLPVRMDQELLPAISFDLDVHGQHIRRPDGYLQAEAADCQGYAVVARPVSILKKMGQACRKAYGEEAVVIGVSEWEEMLKELSTTRKDAAAVNQAAIAAEERELMQQELQKQELQIQQQQEQQEQQASNSGYFEYGNPEERTVSHIGSEEQVEQFSQRQYSYQPQKQQIQQPISMNSIEQPQNVQQYSSTAPIEEFDQNESPYSQKTIRTQPNYTKPGQFSKIRPPTPPRKTDPNYAENYQSPYAYQQAKAQQSRPEISYRPVQTKPGENINAYGFNESAGIGGIHGVSAQKWK